MTRMTEQAGIDRVEDRVRAKLDRIPDSDAVTLAKADVRALLDVLAGMRVELDHAYFAARRNREARISADARSRLRLAVTRDPVTEPRRLARGCDEDQVTPSVAYDAGTTPHEGGTEWILTKDTTRAPGEVTLDPVHTTAVDYRRVEDIEAEEVREPLFERCALAAAEAYHGGCPVMDDETLDEWGRVARAVLAEAGRAAPIAGDEGGD